MVEHSQGLGLALGLRQSSILGLNRKLRLGANQRLNPETSLYLRLNLSLKYYPPIIWARFSAAWAQALVIFYTLREHALARQGSQKRRCQFLLNTYSVPGAVWLQA